MKTMLALTSSIMLALPSCAWYGTDKNGKPTGVLLATRAGKISHTGEGFYAENLDTQTGFKDAMDFGGTAVGTVVGGSVLKAGIKGDTSVQNTSSNNSTKVATSKEVTKRHSATTKASVETAKIHAATPTAQ